MKVYYDDEVDALYLKLSDETPDGVVELADGVNLDTSHDGKLAGIEILKASKKIDINTILSYTLELNKSILKQNIAQADNCGTFSYLNQIEYRHGCGKFIVFMI